MDAREDREMRQFARDHHVHYEVEPEEIHDRGGRRDVVAYRVKLFATHGESRLEAPGCPRCVELSRELRSFAERLVGSADAAGRTEILPPPAALYQSMEVPGADEVALTARVRCDAPDHRPGGAGEDPCLGELRERLRGIGVPRR